MEATWSLSAIVGNKDNTVSAVVATKDSYGGYRVDIGVVEYLKQAMSTVAGQAFMTKMGYTMSVLSDNSVVNDVVFRFGAVGTNGDQILVIGSNNELSDDVSTNDFDAVIELLNSDADFVALFESLQA